MTRPGNLNDADYRDLEYHVTKALDLVGLDHNFADVVIDAIDDAISIAQED